MAAAVLSPQPQSSIPLNTPMRSSSAAPSTMWVQRWDGNERTATEWNALRRDDELWIEDGECYVYLYRPGQSQRGPSFRLPYEMLVKADCNDLLDHHLISTWNSSPYSPSCPGGECYLYLQAPSELSREEAFQYHIDTRNFFAWMVGVPLVGTDPISALVRLKDRLDAWRDRSADNLGALISYIKGQGYCDVPEPLEQSFTQKPAPQPTTKKRFDSLKRMIKIPTPAYSKRMSEMMVGASPRRTSLVRPVTTIFSAMNDSSDLSQKRASCHEIVVSEYGNGLQTRRSSTYSSSSEISSIPPLSHSREDSASSTSSNASLRASSPSTPHTPDASTEDKEFGLGAPENKNHSISEQLHKPEMEHPQDMMIDSLIAELRDGADDI